MSLDPVVQSQHKFASKSEASVVFKDSKPTKLVVPFRRLVAPDGANRSQRWRKPEQKMCRRLLLVNSTSTIVSYGTASKKGNLGKTASCDQLIYLGFERKLLFDVEYSDSLGVCHDGDWEEEKDGKWRCTTL